MGKNNWPEWSDSEIEILKEMYPDNPNEIVADALGRTPGSVRVRAIILRIHKSRHYIHKIRTRKQGTYGPRKIPDCMPNPLVKIKELNRRFRLFEDEK